jgi:hypothetical protein
MRVGWGECKANAYKVSYGKPEGKRSLGRPGCRWEKDIEIELRGIVWRVEN